MSIPGPLSLVPFVSVDDMMRIVAEIGVERFLTELAAYIEADFRRWPYFDKTPRVAAHAAEGSIELMPTSDGALYAFKYVNGHPKNTREGRQTVVRLRHASPTSRTGYPLLLSEMTILTALRTAATSAMAGQISRAAGRARRWRSSAMARNASSRRSPSRRSSGSRPCASTTSTPPRPAKPSAT